MARFPEFENGDILSVRSHSGEYLGCGYFRKGASLAGRMLWFAETPEETDFRAWAEEKFAEAIAMRQSLPLDGNAWRAVQGESDHLPGLTLDRYNSYWVLQISTTGMQRERDALVQSFAAAARKRKLTVSGLFQKPVPKGSGEPDTLERAEWILGESAPGTVIQENGLSFRVEFEGSQKTGFFLDQRENRQLLRGLSKDRRVLNCFSYTGGFSVYAAAGGASHVTSVDVSQKAVDLARENFGLNQIKASPHAFECADVFEYLRNIDDSFDIIVLDPPAFARSKRDLPQAMKGYRDIHRLAFQSVEKGGFVLTSSCSHPVDDALLRKIIFQAALEARRDVKIIESHRLSADHPVSVFYPEGEYLKGFLLYVE